jgi:hypothetical protein
MSPESKQQKLDKVTGPREVALYGEPRPPQVSGKTA